jgi:hypothetical protein
MGDYQDIRGPSISVSDLLGGFATLSYTYNANNLFFDHTTVSAGYMVFDGLLPEYYINYREPEHVFRPFKKGFLLSFDQSFHIPGKKRVNGTWGYKLRYIYRRNPNEFDSHLQLLLNFGYHLYPFDHILVYPSIQAGYAYHYAHQPKYHQSWDKQNGFMVGFSLNMGYMF